VVATTNRDLQTEVAERRFREDLYYRLNVVRLEIPPLRERAADVPALVGHYLQAIGGPRPTVSLAEDALALLAAYRWPGNVRELVNVVERLLVLGEGELDAAALRALLPELADASAKRGAKR
jgi:DNA-binding NtrC family response regulator